MCLHVFLFLLQQSDEESLFCCEMVIFFRFDLPEERSAEAEDDGISRDQRDEGWKGISSMRLG
jgi:hypothetical protein